MYPIWAMPRPRGGGYERDVTRPRIAVAAEPMSLATSLAHVLRSIDADDVVVIDLRDRAALGGHFDAAIVNEGEEAPVDAAVVIELPGAGTGAAGTPELRVTAAGVSWAQHFASADDLLDVLDAHVPADTVRHPT
jgi:hypothetical protein